jgi:hypothetical protein
VTDAEKRNTHPQGDHVIDLVRGFDMWDASYDDGPFPVLDRLQSGCPARGCGAMSIEAREPPVSRRCNERWR